MREINIAVFITSHGLGHAARASALMAGLAKERAGVRFHIYTQSPEWFFKESLNCSYTYHSIKTDVGLVQKGPFAEDIPSTIDELDRWLPFSSEMIDQLAIDLTESGCQLVICDISPLGIQVAKAGGITSILIENFTWDWIYEEYIQAFPRLEAHIDELRGIFQTADIHIKASPYCIEGTADLVVHPISRVPKTDQTEIHNALNIPSDKKIVMITMGGIPDEYPSIEPMRKRPDLCFLLPGMERTMTDENLVCLPHHSGYYHPDLIGASDVLVGKVGYSTLSEAYASGIPYGFVTRQGFRESPFLAEFARTQMNGVYIPNSEYRSGYWLEKLDELLSQSKSAAYPVNGADQVVDFIYQNILPVNNK